MSSSQSNDAATPTAEMISFYELRTREHIARVSWNLHLLADELEFGDELKVRAKDHDASKFSEIERIPYVWLTEYHRCRHRGIPFEYPVGIEARVRIAIDHHVTTNRHHFEYHEHPDAMTLADLVEMVCDWTAMAQEFRQNNGSAREWAKKTIGNKVQFNSSNESFIYQKIDQLDQLISIHGSFVPGGQSS